MLLIVVLSDRPVYAKESWSPGGGELCRQRPRVRTSIASKQPCRRGSSIPCLMLRTISGGDNIPVLANHRRVGAETREERCCAIACVERAVSLIGSLPCRRLSAQLFRCPRLKQLSLRSLYSSASREYLLHTYTYDSERTFRRHLVNSHSKNTAHLIPRSWRQVGHTWHTSVPGYPNRRRYTGIAHNRVRRRRQSSREQAVKKKERWQRHSGGMK